MTELKNTQESPKPLVWTSEEFKRYLLSLDSNRPEDYYGCLEASAFPGEIILSSAWHKTFADIRRGTQRDGQKRLAFIGTDRLNSKIILSPAFVNREHPESKEPLSEDELFFQFLDQNAQHGIEGAKGMIINRPRDLTGSWGPERDDFYSDNLFDILRVLQLENEMSAPPLVIINVGPTGETTAFRTRFSNTVYTPQESLALRNQIAPIPASERTLQIAQVHNIVIYKGKVNRELKRIYP